MSLSSTISFVFIINFTFGLISAAGQTQNCTSAFSSAQTACNTGSFGSSPDLTADGLCAPACLLAMTQTMSLCTASHDSFDSEISETLSSMFSNYELEAVCTPCGQNAMPAIAVCDASITGLPGQIPNLAEMCSNSCLPGVRNASLSPQCLSAPLRTLQYLAFYSCLCVSSLCWSQAVTTYNLCMPTFFTTGRCSDSCTAAAVQGVAKCSLSGSSGDTCVYNLFQDVWAFVQHSCLSTDPSAASTLGNYTEENESVQNSSTISNVSNLSAMETLAAKARAFAVFATYADVAAKPLTITANSSNNRSSTTTAVMQEFVQPSSNLSTMQTTTAVLTKLTPGNNSNGSIGNTSVAASTAASITGSLGLFVANSSSFISSNRSADNVAAGIADCTNIPVSYLTVKLLKGPSFNVSGGGSRRLMPVTVVANYKATIPAVAWTPYSEAYISQMLNSTEFLLSALMSSTQGAVTGVVIFGIRISTFVVFPDPYSGSATRTSYAK